MLSVRGSISVDRNYPLSKNLFLNVFEINMTYINGKRLPIRINKIQIQNVWETKDNKKSNRFFFDNRVSASKRIQIKDPKNTNFNFKSGCLYSF